MHPIAVTALVLAAVIATAWTCQPRQVRRRAPRRVRALAYTSVVVLLTVSTIAAGVLPGVVA